MIRQLDAVFEAGSLRPLEPLALHEHQRVRLILDDRPEIEAGSAPRADDRREDRNEEMRWLAEKSGPYAGKWVALSGAQLIAHGTEASAVRLEARAAGVERPLLTHIPEDDSLPFGGW